MNPGGPYTVTVSYVTYETLKREDINLSLGESAKQDFELSAKATELTAVNVVTTRTAAQGKGGTETTISRDKMANLPTVGRNLTDYLRATPQAKFTSTEGAISIAGQNNRYNAFYVDGALNNDVFGLAASGTNGGQANVAPISIDAIDQIQVVISPYDASLSGFTGGGINAITRSGTNNVTGSVYYTFRNEKLTGKNPIQGKDTAQRLPAFKNQTYGFRVGGPIVKNKAFYFLSAEMQRDERPQQFDFANYKGASTLSQIQTIADYVKTTYGYDPGGFLNNPESINANRIAAKVDWQISNKNRFSLAYRYNFGERYNTASSSSSTINFYNNGVYQPSKAHYVTAELRSNLNKSMSNRLLLTYAHVDDDRGPIGSSFPRVSLFDGASGTIIFGSDNSSTINLLTQRNFNLLDIFRYNVGKHNLSIGTDNEYNKVYNAFIQNTFGNYQYATIDSFLQNKKPRQYIVGYSLLDNNGDATQSAADFSVLRLAGFINDEWRPSQNLTVNFGIRADKTTFVTDPATDDFTNDVAIPKYSQYYDLHGARSGQKPKIPISISPRLGFSYKIPVEGVTIRGGIGVFTGRIPLVWPGGTYNNNGKYQGGFTASSTQNPNALNTIRFRPDPNNQYRAQDVGITISKGGLNLISKEFHLPKVFKGSLAFDKQLGSGWITTIEALITKNLVETYYDNINILPPTGKSAGPGSRNVYPAPNTIPITSTGANPYDNAILLSNAPAPRGFSYNFTFGLEKRFQKGFAFNATYTYGDAVVVHEPTSSVNLSQWSFVETVNGRNYISRSISDFSLGHRIFAYGSKKFTYANKLLSTTITLVFTGQSGQPFSYVYSTNSAVRDLANATTTNDLIYIPSAGDIQSYLANGQILLNGTFTAAQQAAALESYIQNNKYLSRHRGEFADRNADRMPFTKILDLSLKQDINIGVGKKRYQFQVGYDVFNFTNMLKREWGRTYFLSNDNIGTIVFAGYINASTATPSITPSFPSGTTLIPTYRFNTALNQPQSINNISTSSSPSFSPRWTSQVSLRFNF
jgi:outer membrane receptor for ferrienterochelin and colicin